MKERPILFSAPMVRAILEGRKTQTRRVVTKLYKSHPHLAVEPYYATGKVLDSLKNQPGAFMEFRHRQFDDPNYRGSTASFVIRCPYGAPGELLWVRETWCVNPRRHFGVNPSKPEHCLYRADEASTPWQWTPSIHMPRWASRITLRITDVRVERLQEISEEDAIAEGVDTRCQYPPDESPECSPGHRNVDGFALDNFRDLWCSINGPESWAGNPWVWVVGFERVAQAARVAA